MSGKNYSQIPALRAIRGVVAKQHGETDSQTVKDTLYRMAGVMDAAEAFAGITRKPTETADAYQKRVEANAEKVTARIESFAEGTRSVHGELRKKLIADADKAAGLVAGGPFDAEIRSAFKALGTDKQMSYLNQLKNKGDGAQLAAILDAPPILTGLTEKVRDEFRAGYVADKAPQVSEEIAALDDLVRVSETVARTAESLAADLTREARFEAENPKEQARREQEAVDARAAVEAQAALDAVIGNG